MGYDPDDYTDDLGGSREHNNREATVGWRDRLAVVLEARDARHDLYECVNGHQLGPDNIYIDPRGVTCCLDCRLEQRQKAPPRTRRVTSW